MDQWLALHRSVAPSSDRPSGGLLARDKGTFCPCALAQLDGTGGDNGVLTTFAGEMANKLQVRARLGDGGRTRITAHVGCASLGGSLACSDLCGQRRSASTRHPKATGWLAGWLAGWLLYCLTHFVASA